MNEVLALTGPQLRALVSGHRRVDAIEAAQRMDAVRAAVWAGAEEYAALVAALREDGGGDRAGWLEGWTPGGGETED